MVTSFLKPWKHGSVTQPHSSVTQPHGSVTQPHISVTQPHSSVTQPHIPTTLLWEHKILHTYRKAGNEVVTQVQGSQVQQCQDPVRENSRDGIIPDVKFLKLQARIQHRLDFSYVSLCRS